MGKPESFDALVHAVASAVDAYRGLPPEAFMELPRVLKSGRRRVLVHKAQPLSPFAKDRLLADFLDTELLDWEFAANQLAVENEYRESADPRLRADHAVSMLLDLMDRAPQADSTALARRFVGYLCGPRLPPVEYVVIDLAPERSVICPRTWQAPRWRS